MNNTAPPATTIRAEQPDDGATIADVVGAAFESQAEVELVALLRASPSFVPEWSLVAERDGAVVGHVMVTWAELDDGLRRHRVANLSPLAVAPARQGQGIGSALVRAVAALVDARGEPLILLQGDPNYYRRFGFEHSLPCGVRMDLPVWAPREAAQILRLSSYEAAIRGHVVLPPAFASVEDR